MATPVYDPDDSDTDTPSPNNASDVSTLPPNASGAIAKAKARIGSPRSTGQAIAANAPDVYDPDAGSMVPATSSYPVGALVDNALGAGVNRYVQSAAALTNTGYAAPGDVPATPSAPQQSIGQLSPASPSPSGVPYGMGNRGGNVNQIGQTTAASLAPAPVAPSIPGAPGVTRNGNAYSGSQAMAAPSQPLGTMTDDQRNNAPFAAQYAAMQAQGKADAANQATQQQAMARTTALQSNAYDARVAAQTAARNQDIAQFNASLGHGPGLGSTRTLGLLAQQAMAANQSAQGRMATANTAAANGSPIDYLGNLGKSQAYVAGGQQMAQNALTDPLHVAQLQQGLQAGGTQQQIAQLTLRQHEREQNMLDAVQSAKTPEERQQLIGQIMALRGQPMYDVHVGAGGFNPQTGMQYPGQAFVSNRLTGEVKQVGGAQTPTGAAPQEGQTGTINGVRVRIVNGRPVPI